MAPPLHEECVKEQQRQQHPSAPRKCNQYKDIFLFLNKKTKQKYPQEGF